MAKRRIRVVSAALIRNGRYLITQRKETAVLPLLWEFPGGRVEEAETDAVALARELKHRLGVAAEVCEQLSETQRDYDDYVVDLHLYRCEMGSVEPRPLGVRDMRWVLSSEFESFEFTPADQASMDALLFGQRR